jgi:hypothetical protein
MSTLSAEARETITTLELIQAHRSHIARISEDVDPTIHQLRIDVLTERINNLLGGLSNAGYEVEYHENTTTVLKAGQKWLERSDWAEYPVTAIAWERVYGIQGKNRR